MRATSSIALVIVVLMAISGGSAWSGALPQGSDPGLEIDGARIEAWWLVSTFRFIEAKEALQGLEGVNRKEIELIDALDEFAISLIDLLVQRGRGVTLKLKSGDVVKGKPLEFTRDNVIRLHNKKTVPLQQLSWSSIASLARSAAKRKSPEDNALIAISYIIGGDAKKSGGSLRKAGGALAPVVKELAEAWPAMAEELQARHLVGIIMGGDVATFRAAAETLGRELSTTDVYNRYRDELRAAILPLITAEGRIGGGLNPLDGTELGGGRRRLIYGFLSAKECEDWEFLSFEEASADLHRVMTQNMLRFANDKAEKGGYDLIDVEARPTIEDDELCMPPGTALRHRLLFRGSFKVTFEIRPNQESISLPYAVVHGGKNHYLYSYFWSLSCRKPDGQIREPEIEKKESYPVPIPFKLSLTVKKSREKTAASLTYGSEDCGTVDAKEVEEGYLTLGTIGATNGYISRILIDGEVVPESMEMLAESRRQAEMERLIP